MLRSLRDDSGKPTVAVRGLALLVALLLAFPLTVWILNMASDLLDAAF